LIPISKGASAIQTRLCLLDEPLNHREDVDEVETLNLLRLQGEGTLHLDQRLDDLLTELTVAERKRSGTHTSNVLTIVKKEESSEALCTEVTVHLHTETCLLLEEDINLHIRV
jgi:hypothetical protein